MSGGKRFKFAGSKIGILASFAASALTITGITNANPAIVTSTAHGLVEGDLVRIVDVLGMTEVNDELYVVGTVTANTFALMDVDSTDYGDYDSGGEAEKGIVSNFCELTQYNRTGGSSGEMDATTLCSKSKEFETDLPDFGTTQLSYNFAPRTAVQGKLQQAYESGEKIAVVVELPKNGGKMIQLGTVQQTSETSGNGALWTASATIRNTGSRIDLA